MSQTSVSLASSPRNILRIANLVVKVVVKELLFPIATLVVRFLILVVAIVGLAVWLMPDRYGFAFRYDVDSNNVYVDKKPKNCDWGRAPVGDKGCHYKKVVTPQRNEQNKVTSVYVTWERVED